ncbi:5-amino-6-(D-ribitylamino)uracil--L-tyrosine 4-hydroxyphenyl transferase CofH [Azospirillum canadense]|uniref:5-amino-6-(D-ribitylamino)uracil--L-tyrosine 4-hydroxyphenyl transferase CofH n=1 Tax=Azospirillum canadense TaxID=403962 RepID=UPI002226212C|nr:5-amino-6-(D-ribitylamino)uracil--L-tyrosine 4-hydroxyphenyl transferase CofH [Azospirillum canadense]MCW2239401.1 FO synthase [Azospirillum canadense]
MTDLLSAAARGDRLDDAAVRQLAASADTAALLETARARRDLVHGALVTYSPKVFIPLTKLCRDTCRYCTFAETPRPGLGAYLTPDEVLAIARAGAAAGCREALFTLGDKPELRWGAARVELERLGHASTISYLAAMAKLVLDETGLLPHANPGTMDGTEVAALRRVSVSQGMMVEVLSERLCAKGGPHHGCPDKHPAPRLATLEAAGRARVPFTTGILMGIGETPEERIDSLLAIRAAHERHGHIQEVIVQNFRAKPGTRMAEAPDAPHAEHLRAIALARLILPPEMTVQAPPNLSPGHLEALVHAGIDDWGGVSPVTIDHVNPEAPWPHLPELEARTHAAGKELAPRLAAHPRYVHALGDWIDPALHRAVRAHADAAGLARDAWSAGQETAAPPPPAALAAPALASGGLSRILTKARDGRVLSENEIVRLFEARGQEFASVTAAANALRRDVAGDTVTYVVCRNINYTNICSYRCRFCAFSKGKTAEALRGRPYDLPHEEIAARTREAWERGGTEVCMQGGIHPDYTGQTYLDILATVKGAVPDIHVHAFSPLEVRQGAGTLGIGLEEFLTALRRQGLGSLPGTAAEILDDEVRAVLCPDKLNTAQWLEVMRTAHGLGLRSTATIMYGHIERPVHWARHLIRIRDLQRDTGGFTEFVPLPFVHMEAPIYLKGGSRKGPTWREAVLMHAVGRLALNPWIPNIQTSWVKMGPEGVVACLNAGANDLGGTLMDESITRAAGAAHGQEMPPAAMEALVAGIGRTPRQRTTLYGHPPAELVARSFRAAPLRLVRNPPLPAPGTARGDRSPATIPAL